MVLFIVAAAQILGLHADHPADPARAGRAAWSRSRPTAGPGCSCCSRSSILIFMGSVLEGAAALIIFGPLLMPVARQLGIDPLHYGIVLVIGMGIGLFAPPLGLGLYGSCLIGGRDVGRDGAADLKYLGVLFLCLLLIAFDPRDHDRACREWPDTKSVEAPVDFSWPMPRRCARTTTASALSKGSGRLGGSACTRQINPSPRRLIASAGRARIIVADRMTAGPAEVFGALPDFAAFVRVAVDIRNIDVEAASRPAFW